MTKKTLFALYVLTIVSMGAATIIEKYKGTDYTSAHIYGAWWFTLLWALLAATAVVYFIRRRVRKPSAVALHLSFVVILAGALLTHVFSRQGMIHLRMGEITDKYQFLASNGKDVEERQLPFSIKLDNFDIKYHEGTMAVADYETRFTIVDRDGKETPALVSMNNIYSHGGIRLYQASYDEDRRGSILSMNDDPWGITVTYAGYALLFLSLLWMLFDPKGAFRQLLRSPLLKRGVLMAVLSLSFFTHANALNTMPKETAEKFGTLNILYNDRICPLQTFAIDFTKKLYGKASYRDYTAEQVLAGFIFWSEEWSGEPLMKMKGGVLKSTLQLPDYCSVSTFFNPTMGGYILGPYVQEYYQGQQDKFHRQAADVDDRLMLVMELRQGTLLKMFPHTTKDGTTTWYAPTDKLPSTINRDTQLFVQNLFALLQEYLYEGDNAKVSEVIDKIARYQQANGGSSLPTPQQTKAERIYNKVPFATILFMANLTIGLLSLLLTIVRLTLNEGKNKAKGGILGTLLCNQRATNAALRILMSLSVLTLTLCLALRWVVSGKIPMANGYETMLFVAWLVMLLSLAVSRRFRIALPLGFIMSGFFLLVSHIGQMDPNISHVMPVLNSPLLSVHVSVIMLAFALLSLTFICGLTALLLHVLAFRNRRARFSEQTEALALLSRLFLYPALAALGFGIFIGAVWANVSWGKYWGWDPKEVWALITFMVYAAAAHVQSLPSMRRPMTYHVFMTLAFLTILMTYFGVNYFLGGMHSYA